MNSPASLLSVARQVGALAGLEPAHVQRCYAALQAAELLPRSHGRAIYPATPGHLATLLIGLAADRATPSLRESVVLLTCAGKDGGAWEGEWFHTELVRLLTQPDAADDVEKITFDLDRHQVTIQRRGEAPADYFNEETTFDANLIAHDTTHDPRPLIASDRVVSGKLLQVLSRTILWQVDAAEQTPE